VCSQHVDSTQLHVLSTYSCSVRKLDSQSCVLCWVWAQCGLCPRRRNRMHTVSHWPVLVYFINRMHHQSGARGLHWKLSQLFIKDLRQHRVVLVGGAPRREGLGWMT
jgi:hypothetical protein